MANGTTFYLTDTLGSILASFNNAAGGASIKGNQVFGPYGTGRYYKGNINTLKGFTGQYNDGSGLDYFNARYYDPAVGVFLSADTASGNMAGMNPYAYVNGNPETYNDPTGLMPCAGPGGYCGWPSPSLPMNAVQPSNLVPPVVVVGGGGGGGLQPSGGTTQTLAPYSPFAVKHTVGTTKPSTVDFGANTCATQGVSQVLCSNGYTNYAFYLPTGEAIGLPGPWSLCSDCGPGGGPNENGGSGGLRDLINVLASDIGGEIGGDAGAGGDVPPADTPGTANRITALGEELIRMLEDEGVVVVRNDPEANAHLAYGNAKGSTLFDVLPGEAGGPETTTVLLGENANDSTVYEEWLHVRFGEQRGWIGLGSNEWLPEEIMVKQEILAKADWLGLSNTEVEDIQQWLKNPS